MNKYEEEILKEQYFVGIGVDREERDFLLSLLSECKDISDSKYKDSIVFDTKMTRLCCNDNDKEYLVLDIFTPNDNGYSLLSRYSGDEAGYIKNIDMKGKVK